MRKILFIVSIVLVFCSCNSQKSKIKYDFDLQGHRGARGLAPENTFPAFQKAVELGVTTLELDVVVSKDSLVIVSHEPWFNPVLTTMADGTEMDPNFKSNFFQMTYEEIKSFDCGSRLHPKFQSQKTQRTFKPLLKDVLREMEQKSLEKGLQIQYNIEIKSSPKHDGLYHPEPKVFIDLVVAITKQNLPKNNFNIQSFDFRTLQILHKNYPEIRLAMLVDEGTFEENLSKLGFTPEIYSSNYKLVDRELIAKAHQRNMKVIPWTVNDTEQMQNLLQMGVDGLITDYPNKALQFRKR